MKVVELKAGDTVMGWLRTGYALRKEYVGATKSVVRSTPQRPTRFSKDDLQRFIGIVVGNDASGKLLHLEVQEMNRLGTAVSKPIPAVVPYVHFTRLRLLSKETFEGQPQNPLRPTAISFNTGFYPYKTSIEVELY
jgi:hypothetical protein